MTQKNLRREPWSANFGFAQTLSALEQSRLNRQGRDCLRLRPVAVLQPLSLIICRERVRNGLEPAFHHLIQLVQRKPDAMIRNSVLREVISANLLAAVSCAHHALAFRPD